MVPVDRHRAALPHGECRHADARRALKMLVAATLAAAMVAGRDPIQPKPSRWVLVYTGGPKRPAYTVDDLVHLTSIVDTFGNTVGPLCDGAILLEFHAVSGRYYMPVAD